MANIVPNKLGSIIPWAYHTLQWSLQILWSAHFELGAQQKVVISQTTGKQRGEDVAKQLNSLKINKNWHTMVPNPHPLMQVMAWTCWEYIVFLAPKGLLNEKRTWQQHKKFTMVFFLQWWSSHLNPFEFQGVSLFTWYVCGCATASPGCLQ